MLPKFHVVLAVCVSTISTHCTAIVLLVLMKGPVKMLVAAVLDEMMAGTLFADVNEPLYVNVLAPDSEIAVAAEDGVIDPVTLIVAADVHDSPVVVLPLIDPDMLIFVADVFIAIADIPPVIEPVIVNVVPEKDIPTFGDESGPPTTLPIIVKLPAVCNRPILPVDDIPPPAPPVIFPIIIVFPSVEAIALLLPTPAEPPDPPDKLPVIVIVPFEDLEIHRVEVTPEVAGVKVNPFNTKLQLPLCTISTSDPIFLVATLLPKVRVTVPVVAVICTRLVAPGTKDVLAAFLVQLPLTPAVLKLNVPPAVILVPDVFLNDNTSKLVSTFTVNVLEYASSAVVGSVPVFHTVVSDQFPFFTALTSAISYNPAIAAICAPVLATVALFFNRSPIVEDPVRLVTGVFHISFDIL